MINTKTGMNLTFVGFDPSLRNWGVTTGVYSTSDKQVTINHIDVIQPVLSKSKQIRQNSLDIESSMQLFEAAYRYAKDAQIIFVEVPVGSQSARSMASYGICVGVLGSLKGMQLPIIELTPIEVKMAAVGIKTATKEQMIAWAYALHPETNWPMYKSGGVNQISEAKAEHMADAIGTVYAGIRSTPFQQLLSTLVKANNANQT